MELATIQDRDIAAIFIGEKKERETKILLEMNSVRSVGKRVNLGTIVANPRHNVSHEHNNYYTLFTSRF